MVNFEEIYHFSRFQRGSNIFQGGGGGGGGSNFFQGGGVQLLIPYRNPYNLWFSRGGSGPPVPPPLDPHLIEHDCPCCWSSRVVLKPKSEWHGFQHYSQGVQQISMHQKKTFDHYYRVKHLVTQKLWKNILKSSLFVPIMVNKSI